jgi:YceI-like domain
METVHRLGPDNATLIVRTERVGAIAKVGHDLLMDVTSWEGELDLGDRPSATLTADASSLRVREGTGGMQRLGDDDKRGIEQTIDDEVLKRTPIRFRSTSVVADGGRLHVEGELELSGQTHPLGFELEIADDGRLTGAATVKQSSWGMKPYSTLFGTLKVADDVVVEIDAKL